MDGPKRTYDNQDMLPPLPVPDLSDSIDLYLESLEPFVPELLSPEEFENTKQICDRFLEGKGRDLHFQLLQKAKGTRNWLSEWWLKYAYHIWRDPIPVTSNYFGMIEDRYIEQNVTQIEQAANVIWCFLAPLAMYRNQIIPPQYMKKGTVPLDMDCYSYLFTGMRIPGENCDSFENIVANDKIVIMVNNQMYSFKVKFNGIEFTQDTIKKQLEWIVEDSLKNVPEYDVSVLTTENRSVWAEYREKLITLSDNNEEAMETITNSFLMVTLDNRSPPTEDDAAYLISCDEYNKWWDKLSNIIVFKNGKVGCIGEHSPCDAPYIAWTIDYCGEQMSRNVIDRSVQDNVILKQPVRYEWDLTPELKKGIEEAKENYRPLKEDLDIKCFLYDKYGKLFIKESGFSPDSFVQMALQLAYAKIGGVGCATYETGHTRKFFKGRTETVRSFSKESKAFVNAMLTEGVSDIERVEKLAIAVEGHKSYLKRCMEGQGCDRHLLGLRILQLESGEMPDEFFNDKAYVLSSQFKLSTSNMPTKYPFIFNLTFKALLSWIWSCFR
eukprot:TRINITY_DN5206_c0_g1_i1.p1 TRINITY_DN5206_c0_g1~~TRINITY_DN5206_c0_g1_i1.p1  ORF type:complete len:552 (-),score=117.45 TRINITY_DN5206_c0_g1_i1:185-1840(-)